jgi:hypothetical protein
MAPHFHTFDLDFTRRQPSFHALAASQANDCHVEQRRGVTAWSQHTSAVCRDASDETGSRGQLHLVSHRYGV